MKIELSGKTAIVTGSTAGIGLGIARGLATAGAHVIVTGRHNEKVQKVAQEIGGDCVGIAVDLTTAKGADQLMRSYVEADILVNNLGQFGMSDFFESDDAVWESFWQTNVMSGVRLARHYLSSMERKGWGRVIFLGSESAFNIPHDAIPYGVSKTACVALARGLAKRMAGTGVTVNSVLAGPTMTEGMTAMMRSMHHDDQQPFEDFAAEFTTKIRPSTILRRASTVEEVANMVVYLASSQSSATTGAALRVDGGVIDTIM